MIVTKLTPQGFCGGVKYALHTLDKALENPSTPRPIYLMGNIIHNKTVMNEYKEKGVIVLNESYTEDKALLIASITKGTIIFSAHGTDKKLIDRALNKGLNVINTVCPNVKIVHKKIMDHIKLGYDIIYIGTKRHPECEAVLSIDKNIHLVSNLDDINNLIINNKNIYITNQTTLSQFDLAEYFKGLMAKYPEAIIDNKICTATTERQAAVYNQKPTDLCIIVGDKLSSNSNKLYKIALRSSKKAIFIETIKDLNPLDLKDASTISITSGASTPDYLVDEIINYLKTI